LPLLAWLGLAMLALLRMQPDGEHAGEARQVAWASLITLLITGSVIDVHYFVYYMVLSWILVGQAMAVREANATALP
jgi:hypothetical protein